MDRHFVTQVTNPKMGKKVKQKKQGNRIVNSKGAYQSIDYGEDQPVIRNRRHRGHQSDAYNKGNVSVDQEKRLRNTLRMDGLEIVEMSPDGNCLFRSLSDQLFGDYGNNHGDVRSAICDYIEKHQEDFKVFLVFEDKDDEDQQEEDARDFEHYVEIIRKDGEWGGNLEIVAASRCYRRKITVFSTTLSAFTIDHGESKSLGNDLLISYHDNDHYNSVRDVKSPPKPVKNISESKSTSFDDNSNSKETHSNKSGNAIEENQPKDSEGRSIGDALTDATEDVTESMSTLFCNTKGSKPKKSALCPCGSGLKSRKCCLTKERRAAARAIKQRGAETTHPAKREDADLQPDEQPKSRGQFQVVSI